MVAGVAWPCRSSACRTQPAHTALSRWRAASTTSGRTRIIRARVAALPARTTSTTTACDHGNRQAVAAKAVGAEGPRPIAVGRGGARAVPLGPLPHPAGPHGAIALARRLHHFRPDPYHPRQGGGAASENHQYNHGLRPREPPGGGR